MGVPTFDHHPFQNLTTHQIPACHLAHRHLTRHPLTDHHLTQDHASHQPDTPSTPCQPPALALDPSQLSCTRPDLTPYHMPGPHLTSRHRAPLILVLPPAWHVPIQLLDRKSLYAVLTACQHRVDTCTPGRPSEPPAGRLATRNPPARPLPTDQRPASRPTGKPASARLAASQHAWQRLPARPSHLCPWGRG